MIDAFYHNHDIINNDKDDSNNTDKILTACCTAEASSERSLWSSWWAWWCAGSLFGTWVCDRLSIKDWVLKIGTDLVSKLTRFSMCGRSLFRIGSGVSIPKKYKYLRNLEIEKRWYGGSTGSNIFYSAISQRIWCIINSILYFFLIWQYN